MTIDWLHIRGYQSLGDVRIDLGRVTVLRGDSDQGKSAVLRALEQAAFNDGGGDVRTVHHGEVVRQAEVRIGVRDGAVVSWERAAETVRYQVGEGKEGTKFAKVKKNVPELVTQTLGMRDVQIDSGTGPTSWERVQFVGQFDPPFLLVDRGGVAAARVLGRLTGVHIFAEAGRLAGQDAQQLKLRDANLSEQVQAAEVELVAIGDVDTPLATLYELQEAGQQVRQTLGHYDRMSRIEAEFRSLEERIAAIGFDPDVAEQGLEVVRAGLRDVWATFGRLKAVDQVCLNWEAAEQTVERYQAQAEIELPTTADLQADLGQQLAVLSRLITMQHGIAQAGHTCGVRETELAEAERGLAEVEAAKATFDAQIPLCPFVDKFRSVAPGPYRCAPLNDSLVAIRSVQ